jgi:hypothetical protein
VSVLRKLLRSSQRTNGLAGNRSRGNPKRHAHNNGRTVFSVRGPCRGVIRRQSKFIVGVGASRRRSEIREFVAEGHKEEIRLCQEDLVCDLKVFTGAVLQWYWECVIQWTQCRGIAIVESCYPVDWEDSAEWFVAWKSVRMLYFSVVKTCKWPINPITNRNPIYRH